MEELDKEKELIFKRFSDDKQEQIRQLVAYTTLMGLTGKDLISIGGKLTRLEEKMEREANLRIAEGYEANIVAVGKTKQDKERNKNNRWVYTDSSGCKFEFTTSSIWQCNVTNRSTNKRKHFYLERYITTHSKGKGPMYNALLNIHHGNIKLNF